MARLKARRSMRVCSFSWSSAGYTRNVNIRVAGYDFRLTPDMGGFMERTVRLIEETYRENRNTPVHLVGHSNGPLYIQYLLTHTTQQWKNKYIQGFTSLAGNLPGQGSMYSMLFTGFNIMTASYPTDLETAASSAAMLQSHPSSYMSASDPAYFRKSRSGGAGSVQRKSIHTTGLQVAV